MDRVRDLSLVDLTGDLSHPLVLLSRLNSFSENTSRSSPFHRVVRNPDRSHIAPLNNAQQSTISYVKGRSTHHSPPGYLLSFTSRPFPSTLIYDHPRADYGYGGQELLGDHHPREPSVPQAAQQVRA